MLLIALFHKLYIIIKLSVRAIKAIFDQNLYAFISVDQEFSKKNRLVNKNHYEKIKYKSFKIMEYANFIKIIKTYLFNSIIKNYLVNKIEIMNCA